MYTDVCEYCTICIFFSLILLLRRCLYRVSDNILSYDQYFSYYQKLEEGFISEFSFFITVTVSVE